MKPRWVSNLVLLNLLLACTVMAQEPTPATPAPAASSPSNTNSAQDPSADREQTSSTIIGKNEPSGGGTPGLQPPDKRVFWIIPNYRTYSLQQRYEPISRSEKFKIATDDAFDRGTFALAALFGGYADIRKATPSFGHGAAAYGRYFGASFGDWAIGDYMTEGIYPSLLHQDPRYFRRGMGNGWSRLGYAIGQTFWTHNDSGRMQFNFSEIAGNSTAAAIGMAYYPDNRDAGSAASQLGLQIGLDMAGDVLKEFWTDLHRKLSHQSQPGHGR